MEQITFNHTNSTTNPKCQKGHEWTMGLSIGREVKNGDPCDCGIMLYNLEQCKCCSNKENKPLPNLNFKG